MSSYNEPDRLDVDSTDGTPVAINNKTPSPLPENPAADDSPDSLVATRPLPIEPVIDTPQGHIVFGQASDTGLIRGNNQDAVFSFNVTNNTSYGLPDLGVFVLADGMGGYLNGEKASALAVRVIVADLLDTICLPMMRGQDMNSVDQLTINEALQRAIAMADQRIREQLADSGTTVTTAVIRGDAIHIAHVGDSRAYWISPEGNIERITRDHSKVQRLVEIGELSEEEAERHEDRNQVYRALGRGPYEINPDIERRRLIPGACVMLCSDGLWSMVRSDELAEIVTHADTPQEACDKLIARANSYGGLDNISVIVIKTPSS